MAMAQNDKMLPIGTKLHGGVYEIIKHLSNGGFGNTYVVKNVSFDEIYAMKEFFMKGINLREGDIVTVSVADNEATFTSQKEKLKKEARRLRQLKNPHIVRVHDLFEERGTVYYVMDYIEGESLAARLQRRPERHDDRTELRGSAQARRISVGGAKWTVRLSTTRRGKPPSAKRRSTAVCRRFT